MFRQTNGVLADKRAAKKHEEENWEAMVELAGNLADCIRRTSAYNEYMAARERLNQDEDNRHVLEELREQQFNAEFDPADEQGERKQRLMDEVYMAISMNPVVSDYLNAEYKLELMMEELRKAFGDLFDFAGEEDEQGRFNDNQLC